MSSDDGLPFIPTLPSEGQRPQTNRTVLGALIVLLLVAVLLALWFLVFDDDEGANGTGDDSALDAGPTPVTIPTSTPGPVIVDAGAGDDDESASALPTPLPTSVPTTPTPVPEGFEACGTDRAPSTTGTYIVDTSTTPLNQRVGPSVASDLAGSFDPGTTGLVFTGECLVNLGDGFVWWEIETDTATVWVASDFVSPN